MVPRTFLCKPRIEAILICCQRQTFMDEHAQIPPQDTIQLLTAVSHLSTLKPPHSCDPH